MTRPLHAALPRAALLRRALPRAALPRLIAPLALALAGALASPFPAAAADATGDPTGDPTAGATAHATTRPGEADLFAMPAVAEALRTAAALAASGEIAPARRALDALAERHPAIGVLQASRAALAMLSGAPEAALEALEAAAGGDAAPGPLAPGPLAPAPVDPAPVDPAALARAPVFAPLAADPAFAPRLASLASMPSGEAPAPPPAPVADGVAAVDGASTRWNPESERLEARFAHPPAPAGGVLPGRPVTAAHDLLREHWRRGRAAGHRGDLYDNRDRGHSALDPASFPQLARTAYGDAARAAGIDYGLNDAILFDGIAFGNSSTAITGGPHWRSLPRHALTRPDGTGPMRLWQNWAGNHLYVHPAHHDWGREHGDLFPANTPYLLVSRGSSGSDQPFLEAVAMILAAFRPETKARLAEARLVVPAVQMVFRRSLQPVRSREDYFSGLAHPPVFEARDINLARMVSLAQSIEPGALPAEARIAVLEEALGREGVDFFGAGLSEQLFDTPSAVARIWRSHAWRRTMTLSAEASRDADGRPLTFHWRLLQGDPGRVRIEPLGDGARARVTLDWHDPFPVSATDPQVTSRVDIAVFAHNGVHDSAPAILSWHFPAHEARRYEDAPEGGRRIAEIDYSAGRADPAPGAGADAGNGAGAVYADPFLYPRAAWRDIHRYAGDGTPLGWTRERPGGRRDDYDARGARILEAGAAGPPARTDPVAYPLAPGPGGTLVVEEVSR